MEPSTVEMELQCNALDDQAQEAEIDQQIARLWSAQKDQAATARRS
jgi:hypothetical protein